MDRDDPITFFEGLQNSFQQKPVTLEPYNLNTLSSYTRPSSKGDLYPIRMIGQVKQGTGLVVPLLVMVAINFPE